MTLNLSIVKNVVKVKVVEDDDKCVLIQLNIESTLSKIREILEYNEIIRMDDTLLFYVDSIFITRKDESSYRLEDIIKKDNTLCLKKSTSNLDYFTYKLNLRFGRILIPDNIKIKNSKKEVLKMKIKESTSYGEISIMKVDFNSKEELFKYINMFFNAEAEMINFGAAGLFFSNEQSTSHQTKISYRCTKIPKLSLRFNELKPTQEFIEDVKEALEQKNRGNFNKIYEDFGQFIPTEVILGGIAYKGSNEVTASKNFSEANLQGGSNREELTTKLLEKTNRTILIGGNPPPSLEYFDETEWIKSLDDHKTWECIEFRNPINIFQLLDDELRKEVYKFLGKKILYSEILSYSCRFEHGKQEIVKLPLPSKICEIIKNKEADCSVFATVVDDEEKKNDFFNCQIFHPRDELPRLIIHCFQKKQHLSLRKLKIAFMIVGYDIYFNLNDFNRFIDEMRLKVLSTEENNQELNRPILNFESNDVSSFLGIPVLKSLNMTSASIVIGHYFLNIEGNIGAYAFSYCSKENKYVELPNFRFHVLVISGNSERTYGTIPFTKRKFVDLEKYFNYIGAKKNNTLIPRYISVYSVDESCGPDFLKQKRKEIKLKYLTCKCKTCPFCKNRPSGSNVKCAYLVSNYSDVRE